MKNYNSPILNGAVRLIVGGLKAKSLGIILIKWLAGGGDSCQPGNLVRLIG